MHISADGTNLPDFSNNIYDVSDDLIQGSLVIRTNGVHTFNFQLQNTQRKYDGVLQPMDRITVEMKRVTWVRVFSGYLNNGPIFSAWPRVLNMSASCTLKRLQFWFWDPTTTAAYNLVTGAMTNGRAVDPNAGGEGEGGATQRSPIGPGQAPATTFGLSQETRESITVRADANRDGLDDVTGLPVAPTLPRPATPPVGNGATPPNPGQPAETGQQKFDDSIKGVVLKILNDVVGWPQDKVHIGAIPENWVKLAAEVGNLALQQGDVRDLLGDFSQGNNQSAPGIDTTAMGATSQDQIGIIKIICDVARGRFGGMARKAAITGVATGLVETELRNLPGGDRDSVGVFQQRPSMGWGTVEQCMNVTYAAGKFFSKFPADWASRDQGQLAQSVQRSAYPDKYGKRMGEATILVDRHGGF